MIQQEHLVKYPTFEKREGKTMTIPGMATNIKQALKMYAMGNLDIIQTYYEEHGFHMPDFAKLDKIQQLIMLRDAQERIEGHEEQLREEVRRSKLKAKEVAEAKSKSDKADKPNQA